MLLKFLELLIIKKTGHVCLCNKLQRFEKQTFIFKNIQFLWISLLRTLLNNKFNTRGSGPKIPQITLLSLYCKSNILQVSDPKKFYFIQVELKSSLILSMLSQMLQEDRNEEVRRSVVKSLSLNLSYVFEERKYMQVGLYFNPKRYKQGNNEVFQ